MERIYARNCELRELTTIEEKEFFNTNHKQGYVASKVAYGLFYDGKLVQAESFGIPRIEIQSNTIWHDWELLRECSSKDYYVLGGKSKLLKAFEINKKPLSLLSYCNLTEGFDGHSYAACGFKLERTSEDYYYEHNGEIIKRYRMQKNKNLRAEGKKEPIQRTLESFGKTYNPNLSEKQNAANAGFKLINGKGQQVWSKYFSNNIGYVYEITCSINGKTYIGQHTLMKNGQLKKVEYFGSGVEISKAVAKYGKKSFKIRPLCWTNDLSKLADLEYNAILEAKANGKAEYNISTCPYSASAHQTYFNGCGKAHHSEETKQKMREAAEGRKMSPETKIKISESLKGKKHKERTREWIDKIINSDGYKNRKPRDKDSYTDEWKCKVAENTAIAMELRKQETIDKIHSMGFVTMEDLMKENGISYKQCRVFKEAGRLNRLKYFDPNNLQIKA